MAYKWEVYKDKVGEFRARFKYKGETMFSTGGYSSKKLAMNAVESAKKNMPDAEVFDSTSRETTAVKQPNKKRLQRVMEEHRAQITAMMNQVIATNLNVTARWANPTTQEGIIIEVWVGNKCVKSVQMIALDEKDPHGLFQLPDNT